MDLAKAGKISYSKGTDGKLFLHCVAPKKSAVQSLMCKATLVDVRKPEFRGAAACKESRAALDWFFAKTPTERTATVMRAYIWRNLMGAPELATKEAKS